MNLTELIMFRMRTVVKFIIAGIEAIIGSSIVSGSQSDLVNYMPVLVYGQLIYRFYELMAIPSPNMQQSYQLMNVFSISSMVLFIQFWYIMSSSLNYQSEKEEFARLYEGRGELCNITQYW